MLIGFLKNPKDSCECKVIKFVDRIWFLNKDGDVEILRSVVVENTGQVGELSSIYMLVPFRNIIGTKLKNHTCFDRNNYFNSISVNTTHKYKIIKHPLNDDSVGDFGIINHDGIENIKVFMNLKEPDTLLDIWGVRSQRNRLWEASIIEYKLPTGHFLKPKEKTEFRIFFKVTSLLAKVKESDYSKLEVFIKYLFGVRYKLELDILNPNKNKEIKIIPTLQGDSFPGGFDIILYLPKDFKRLSGFENRTKEPYYDEHKSNGKKGDSKVEKYIFRARDFFKDKNVIGINDEININGVLEKEVTSIELLTTSKRSNVLGWLALSIAIFGLILTLLFRFYF